MRKPPELVLMLAPALLVTAVVVAFGFVVAPSDDDSERAAQDTRPSASSTLSAPEPERTSPSPSPAKQGGARTDKLTGPRVTLQPKPKPKFKVYDPFSFTIASFNVLGHSHTKPGGNRPGWAASSTRMGWAVGLLNGQGADIVGLQEFQQPQFNNFLGRTGGAWGVWPGMAVGHLGVENSIAWRKDVFTAVQTETVGIPYFGGQERRMPYVLLEHNQTGQRVWVGNFHNPADTKDAGRNGGARRAATGRQIALANQLAATGHPVFFTGDFNERAEYFCPVTAGTTLKAANGGSTGSGCAPPPRMQVDWIFGSDAVTFSGYRVIDGGLVNRTSDHPLVAAEVGVPGRKVPLGQVED